MVFRTAFDPYSVEPQQPAPTPSVHTHDMHATRLSRPRTRFPRTPRNAKSHAHHFIHIQAKARHARGSLASAWARTPSAAVTPLRQRRLDTAGERLSSGGD